MFNDRMKGKCGGRNSLKNNIPCYSTCNRGLQQNKGSSVLENCFPLHKFWSSARWIVCAWSWFFPKQIEFACSAWIHANQDNTFKVNISIAGKIWHVLKALPQEFWWSEDLWDHFVECALRSQVLEDPWDPHQLESEKQVLRVSIASPPKICTR